LSFSSARPAPVFPTAELLPSNVEEATFANSFLQVCKSHISFFVFHVFTDFSPAHLFFCTPFHSFFRLPNLRTSPFFPDPSNSSCRVAPSASRSRTSPAPLLCFYSFGTTVLSYIIGNFPPCHSFAEVFDNHSPPHNLDPPLVSDLLDPPARRVSLLSSRL